MTTAGTELRVGCKIFAAFCALSENQLLMTAERAELSFRGDRMAAIRA